MRIFLLGISILIGTISTSYADDETTATEAGEARYAQNCGNCHGPGGMGLASYPRLAGKDASYIEERLKTYRAGTKIGPNSALMIMMAKPLSDAEIKNLAAYLSTVQPNG
ncbi:MAG: c-type cytochrome [Pseudomonadota bacterium]